MTKEDDFWYTVKFHYFPKSLSLEGNSNFLYANPYQVVPRYKFIDIIIKTAQV